MNRVFLRAISTEDLEFIYKWHSDSNLYKTVMGPYRFTSIDAEREWLQNKTKYNNKEMNLMICLSENSLPIGFLSVREIDWISRKGKLAGVIIGEAEHQSQGYGTDAVKLVLKHFFEDLGLNRMWGFLLHDNLPSLRMLEKCGFQVEGHLKQHAFKNGQFRDVLLIGLCSDQYFEKKQLIN